jgi:hypothetical protein
MGKTSEVISAFASYSTDDREKVTEAVNLLRTAGINLFIDYITLRGGDDWQDSILNAIRQSNRFYVFWSNSAASSKWVDWEWHEAISSNLNSGKPEFIIPVLLDNTPLPNELKKYQYVSLSEIVESSAINFVTEKIQETTGGFKIQFSLTNPSKAGYLNVYDIVPVLFFRHYHILYIQLEPRRLSTVTIKNLRLMRSLHKGTLIESGDGIFASMSIIGDKVYRLQPGEIETFTCQFVVDKEIQTTWALGLIVKYTDSLGKQHIRTSDNVFAFTTDVGFSLVKYNISLLEKRLADISNYDFYDDVVVGFKGYWEVPKEPTIEFDSDEAEVYGIGGIECDWEDLMRKSLSFLKLKLDDLDVYDEMTPVK